MLEEKILKERIEHAKKCLNERTKNKNPSSWEIIFYCCEDLAQLPFILRSFAEEDKLGKKRVYNELNFFNGIIGTIAHLESGIEKPAVYGHFDLPDGKNQINIFLEAIGYRKK